MHLKTSDTLKQRSLSDDIILGAIALILLAAAMYKSIILYALIGLMIAVSALPFASPLILVFFVCLLGLVVPMSLMPVNFAIFKVYGADAVLFFFFAFVVLKIWHSAMSKVETVKRPYREVRLIVLMIVLFCYGLLIEIANGMVINGFPVNDVLGDFRRMYLYPLAFLLPLMFNVDKSHLDKLKYAVILGGSLIILTGLYRMGTGQSFNENYFTMAEYKPRLFAAAETVTLLFALAYAAAAIRFRVGGTRRIIALAIAGLSAAFLCISGWRLAFCLAIVVPMGAFILVAYIRRERLGGIFKALFSAVLLLTITVVILGIALSEQTAEHRERLIERFSNFDYKHDARYYAWGEALNQFGAQPVFGTGIGHQLFVIAKTSDGADLGRHMTTHSYPIDVLYRTGTIGFVLTVLFHGWFNIYFFRRLRSMHNDFHAIVVGLYIGYVCSMAMHALEPVRTGAIVVLYLVMGYIVRLMRTENTDTEDNSVHT